MAHLPRWLIGCVAAAIIASFFALDPSGNLPSWFEKVVDADLAVRARVMIGAEPQNRFPVTIVDIDNVSYGEWGQPVETPKQPLFDAIEVAARRKPVAIVVDVDVTATSSLTEVEEVTKRLTQYGSREDYPPLILMRRLWHFAGDPSKAQPASVTVPTYGFGARTPLTAQLAQLDNTVEHAANIIWSSPLHILDDDGVIRHWRGAEAACNPTAGSSVRAFLSAPAILAAIVSAAPDAATKALASVKRVATEYALEQCSRLSSSRDDGLAHLAASLGVAKLSGRIPFAYHREAGLERAGLGEDRSGRIVPLIVMLSASIVARSDRNFLPGSVCDNLHRNQVSCEAFTDRVVLIGASHVDARDSHVTPLGRSLGVDILASEIAGLPDILTKPGARTSPLFWASLLFIVFARLASALPTVASTSSIVILLVAFTALSGRFGVDAATGYEAVAMSVWMLAAFVALMPFVIAAWRTSRVRSFPLFRHR